MARQAKLRGKKEVQRKVNAIQEQIKDGGPKALFDEMSIEMDEMKARVPVKTGDLRDSGTVHPPELEGTRIRCLVTFGNDQVDYAVDVHEDLEAFHANGQAKFMESVLRESAPYLPDRVARRFQSYGVIR